MIDPASTEAMARALDQVRLQCHAGRLGDAEAICRQALAAEPDHAPAVELLGMIRARCGEIREGIELLERACRLEPDEPAFHNNLGIALKNDGRMEEAIACYERALELEPGREDALRNLGLALRQLRQNGQAASRFRAALGARPSSALAWYHLADILTQEGESEEADLLYRRALELAPGLTEALRDLGVLLLRTDRVAEAAAAFEELVRLRPDDAEAHAALASALLAAHRAEEAEGCCRRALALDPDCAVAHNNLGAVLTRTARFREAEACFRRALEIAPDRLDLRINLVIVLRMQSRPEEADEHARHALTLDPRRADAWYYLASLKVFESASDPDLLAMQRLAEEPSPDGEQRLYLSFGLGKALDDLDRHDLAFAHFARGNQERVRQFLYELRGDWDQAEQVKAVFSRPLLEARAGFGHPSRLPVFILGMPRAGKTLLESLLARHAGVYAGGERGIVQLTREDLGPEIGEGVGYPAHVPHLTREQAWRAAERHLERLRLEAPDALLATNTMPGNYLYVGLIHLLFPEAPIVHCVRDPLDTCLYCYFKLFHSGWDFTYDLETLGRNYLAYHRLMEHWYELLPGNILQVRYEDMVADPEAMGRRVARFCGLTGEPSRALPAKKPGVGRRHPHTFPEAIHSREVGRWRRYRAHLGPLERILAPLYPGGGREGALEPVTMKSPEAS